MSFYSVSTIGDIAAKRLGLAGIQEWKVHSSFTSVCNLVDKDGYLVSIQNIGSSISPLSLIIKTNKSINSLFPVGATITTCSELKKLSLCDTIIQYEDANVFNSRFNPPDAVIAFPESCYDYLNTVLRHSSCSLRISAMDRLRQICMDRLKNVAAALTLLEPMRFQTGAKSLVGLGPGLTPSGDDMLSGICAIARLHQPFAMLIETALQNLCLSELTGKVSAELLKLAITGHYAESIIILLNSLIKDDLMSFVEGCSLMLRTGSSTGEDCLTGLFYGLGSLKTILKSV